MKQAKEIYEEESRIFNLIIQDVNSEIVSEHFFHVVSVVESVIVHSIVSGLRQEFDYLHELNLYRYLAKQ